MNKYDTIKEVFDWALLEDFNAKHFYETRIKGKVLLECNPQTPGLTRITIDSTAGKNGGGEVTIEYSAKILGLRYPDLISIDTIELAHANIVNTGLIKFDISQVLATARALKVHQTRDSRLSQPLPEYGRVIAQQWVPNGYDLHNDAKGKEAWQSFSFKRDIKENPEYLKFYNKFREFMLSRNFDFRTSLGRAQSNQMLRHFHGISRAELCLSSKKKMQQHFTDVSADVLLLEVLTSKVDALSNLVTKLIASPTNAATCSALDFKSTLKTVKEYQIFSTLAEEAFNFDTVCENLKSRCTKPTFHRLATQHRALLKRFQAHQDSGQGQALLVELQEAVAGGTEEKSLWYGDSVSFSLFPQAIAA